MGTYIGPGVWEIDTLLGGWTRMTAGYLIEGPAPVLVETGSQTSVPALLAALEEHGVAPADLAGVAVTHIHLDHAGGVGDVARAFPQATVYVHEKGARHLVDPERLVNSAARVYGDLLDSLYGRLEPTPAERIHVLADGETDRHRRRAHPDHGGFARATPSTTWPCTTARAASCSPATPSVCACPTAGVLRPATPPADFDLDQAITSLRKFRARTPAGVALAHYGLLPDPLDMLEEAEGILRHWAEVAERAWRAGEDIAAALETRVHAPARRHRPGPPGQAGDPQRHPFQRRRPAPLAGDDQGRPDGYQRPSLAADPGRPGRGPAPTSRRPAGTGSGRGRRTGRPR